MKFSFVLVFMIFMMFKSGVYAQNEYTIDDEIEEIIEYLNNRSVPLTGIVLDSVSNRVNEVAMTNNEFCFDLLLNVSQNDSGNVFFSPYSISDALAITYEGAAGQTAEEIQSVFHFPADDDSRRRGFSRINSVINDDTEAYELSTANALWAQKDYEFLEDYFQVICDFYDGTVTNLDFGNEPEQARITINNWVEEQTSHRIVDLISEGQISPLTTLVITNAIYFKGTWLYQFDEHKTSEMDFRLHYGNTVKTPMMYLHNEDVKFDYFENDNLQMLELPYDGEELSMFVILPKENLDSIEDDLNSECFDEFTASMEEEDVVIYLPRFSLDTRYLLNDNLSEMGMPLAFTGSADFSGMTGFQALYISVVIHQAFVNVNEEGTEAAAATAVIMDRATAAPSNKVFMANHPFIFLIMEKQTGTVLFIGKVVDPTDQG